MRENRAMLLGGLFSTCFETCEGLYAQEQTGRIQGV